MATRNYIGVLSSVNCSATAARAIADHFSKRNNPAALAKFPNVDGVVALTHGTGCGMDTEGLGIQLLERTLAGYATHANFWGVVANPINSTLGWPIAVCVKATPSKYSTFKTLVARA